MNQACRRAYTGPSKRSMFHHGHLSSQLTGPAPAGQSSRPSTDNEQVKSSRSSHSSTRIKMQAAAKH